MSFDTTMELKTGSGDDRIEFENTIVSDASMLKINAGSGNDYVEFLDADIDGSLSVRMGGGDDRIFVDEISVQQDVMYDGGGGADQLVTSDDPNDVYYGAGFALKSIETIDTF